MALQFVFGNSGCGKTHYIQEQMIKLARNRKVKYTG